MDILVPLEYIVAEEKRAKLGNIVVTDDNKLLQEIMISIKTAEGKVKNTKALIELGTLVDEND